MDTDKLGRLIDQHGLGRHRKALLGLLRPAVRLLHAGGASRLGGEPDVPAGFEWPAWKKRPLAFIGQLRLSDVAPRDAEGALPKSGMLYFFYDVAEMPWGFDPKDAGSARVLFHPVETGLTRMAAPGGLSQEARFEPTPVAAEPSASLPAFESMEIESLSLTRPERDAYWELHDAFVGRESGGPRHQLLGHPDPVQGDMRLECQLASHGIYCGDTKSRQTDKAKALTPGAKDWRLLFQVDTDDGEGGPGWVWGDLGRVYWWIRSEDLSKREFGRTWLVLQCS
jgi:uncharacterized protein YwqG